MTTMLSVVPFDTEDLVSFDNGERVDAIIVHFSKAFDLVPHGRLLDKNFKLGRGR